MGYATCPQECRWASAAAKEPQLSPAEVEKPRAGRTTLHKLTFSPWREGTESRRLWKLSLMWSLRLRSSAL